MKFTQEQFDYMDGQYMSLPEREKQILRTAAQSEIGEIMKKVMGPDFAVFMDMLAVPKRGLAAPR